jgi:hypothetical protein
VLSWQLTSGASSSQCAPDGSSSLWWNDKWNDKARRSTWLPRLPSRRRVRRQSPFQAWVTMPDDDRPVPPSSTTGRRGDTIAGHPGRVVGGTVERNRLHPHIELPSNQTAATRPTASTTSNSHSQTRRPDQRRKGARSGTRRGARSRRVVVPSGGIHPGGGRSMVWVLAVGNGASSNGGGPGHAADRRCRLHQRARPDPSRRLVDAFVADPAGTEPAPPRMEGTFGGEYRDLPITSRKAFVQQVPPRPVLAAHVGEVVQPVCS